MTPAKAPAPATLEQHIASRERPPLTPAQRLLPHVVEAQAQRHDLAISVALDGVALVESRTFEDAHHEVRCTIKGYRALSCSCWGYRQHGVCAHLAWAAIHLWERQYGVDLSTVGARALVPTLLRAHLGPLPDPAPSAGQPAWLASPDGPEERYTGPEAPEDAPLYEHVGTRRQVALL